MAAVAFRHHGGADAGLILPLVKQAIPLSDPSPVMELSPSDTPLSDPFLPGLCLLYAFDRLPEFEIVLERHVSALRLPPASLRSLAIDNLRRRLPRIERHGNHPAYMLTAGGNLESSLLLLEDLWEQQSADVPGELVVAIPARDVVVFTGSESPEGLEAIRGSVSRLWPSGDHLLTRDLFVWRSHSWHLFEPAAA